MWERSGGRGIMTASGTQRRGGPVPFWGPDLLRGRFSWRWKSPPWMSLQQELRWSRWRPSTQTTPRTGIAPRWCTASCRGSRTSLWIQKRVSLDLQNSSFCCLAVIWDVLFKRIQRSSSAKRKYLTPNTFSVRHLWPPLVSELCQPHQLFTMMTPHQ